MTKQEKRDIGIIAGKLLPSFYYVREKKIVSGQELIDKGEELPDGQLIDPEKRYVVEYDRAYPVNHRRRLIDAFNNHGINGISDYIKGQTELHRPREINLHSRII